MKLIMLFVYETVQFNLTLKFDPRLNYDQVSEAEL